METSDNAPDQAQIEQLAHELWVQRGCPEGSPELDWENAKRMLSSPLPGNWASRVESAVGITQAGDRRHH